MINRANQKKVSVDFEPLLHAFDGTLDCFINLNSGEVIVAPDGDDWCDDERDRLAADGRNFAKVDPFPSKVAFGVMEEFVEKLEKKNPAKSQLLSVLRGNKPFRKFKDTIGTLPELQEQWKAFHRKEMEYWVPWWIRKNCIEVEVVIKPPVNQQ